MKDLGYIGLGFTSCAFVQMLSFMGLSFPTMGTGALLILTGILLSIIIAGAVHWLYLRMKGYTAHDHLIIGFMPTLVLLPVFVLFCLAGLHLAFGG